MDNTKNMVKKGVKIHCEGFQVVWDDLPARLKLKMRREFQSRAMIAPATFYYKMRGESPIYQFEDNILADIFRRELNVDYRTGHKLN